MRWRVSSKEIISQRIGLGAKKLDIKKEDDFIYAFSDKLYNL